MRELQVDAQRDRSSDNIRFRHFNERHVNFDVRCAFNARFSGQVRHLFEGFNELWPAIRIARVVNGIHAYKDG